MLRIKRLTDELESANKSLADLATIDGLTQLVNRRVIDLRLAEELKRSRRYKHPLGCILIDIDHFKTVNDAFGHPSGDRVLVEVGGAIREAVRSTDLVGRYGGEEFIVLLPETPTASARVVAERVRLAIAKRTSEKASEITPGVTASLGVATTELGAANERELVQHADQALYRAKREGRNRVVVAGD
jgi:two-component system chemotaxis family response regulator WspR